MVGFPFYSVQFQTDGTTSSDCGSSCSNLQTDIHLAAQTGHQRAHPHSCVQTLHCGAAAAVELWVQSTTKEASVRLQGEQILPHVLHCVWSVLTCNSYPQLTKQTLTINCLPSSTTTYLSPCSTPPWML